MCLNLHFNIDAVPGAHLVSGLLWKFPSGLRLSSLLITGARSPGAHSSCFLTEKLP